jgi:hypothetical protein
MGDAIIHPRGAHGQPLNFYFMEYLMALNTAKTFSMEIEKIANEKRITHMEAVLDYCHRQEIEPDTVGNLISKSLKEKIEANARELNFLPRQAQLPI